MCKARAEFCFSHTVSGFYPNTRDLFGVFLFPFSSSSCNCLCCTAPLPAGLQSLCKTAIQMCIRDRLKDANVDYLKLDMKFMQIDAKNKGKGIQILKSIVDMAYRLGLVIIAEGVETKEQSEILKSMNCNYGQGFYFHRPMSVEAAEERCV